MRADARTVRFACAAMLVSYLPFSAANGALGAIAAATGAGTLRLQWVADAFAVALAALVLPAGALAERLGPRRVALAGLGGTVLGSLLGALAGQLGSIELLWLAQGVAGIGAAGVMSATLSLLAAAAPDPRRRARWIAFWAAATVGGLGGGPFLTSAVTAVASWWWLYPPIALLAAVAALLGRGAAEVPRPARRPVDVAGQVAAAAGVAALVFAVIEGGAAGWCAAAVAVLAFVALGLIERRAAAPLLPPALFTSGGFAAAALAATVVLFAIGGGLFFLSLALSRQHVGQFGIALRLGCLFAGNALGSVAAGRLQRRIDGRSVLTAGLVVAAAGAASLLSVDGAGAGALAWRLAVLGFGAGLVMATSSAVAVQSVPPQFAGLAGAASNAVRQIGAALGPAVLGAILAARATSGLASAVHAFAAVLTGVLLVTAVIAAGLIRLSHRAGHPQQPEEPVPEAAAAQGLRAPGTSA
ncbi:MFS transporter [Dactylosporangium vinaceum]|uniref:MFS transporter n=1 Tax=Dactylosporangium vinaceum TaxID=53362 RepID=A0ABV5MM93_9ACTN|nr:MFS transporter [Dactylosporangium vinaceum]UAB93314.1 MFS transporter [Dactylosporangium vinaceum]